MYEIQTKRIRIRANIANPIILPNLKFFIRQSCYDYYLQIRNKFKKLVENNDLADKSIFVLVLITFVELLF